MSRRFSADQFLDPEKSEEARFLRRLKHVLREAAGEIIETTSITHDQLASKLEIDAAHLSRILNPDRHNTTKSIFKILYKLGKRWHFEATPIPGIGGNSRKSALFDVSMVEGDEPILEVEAYS